MKNNSVAMSLISTGNMKEEVNTMFTALLDAALFWLRQGLPLDTIKIVHHNKTVADSLRISMRDFKNKNNLNKEESVPKPGIEEKAAPSPLAIPPLPPTPAAASPASSEETKKTDAVPAPKDDFEFDIFISYAHVNTDAVNAFVAFLNEINPELRIFHDKESIGAGAQWFMRIYSSLDKSKRVIAFFSPAYFDSGPCIDEYQCAKARQYKLKKPVLLPVYLYNYESMLSIFTLDQWLDCREGDKDKLKEACKKILKQIN